MTISEIIEKAAQEIFGKVVPRTRKVGGKPLSADVGISVTASSPLTVTNNSDASNVAFALALDDSGVTVGNKGDTANQTPSFGGVFKALSATVDAKGRLTALNEHNVTIPSATATASADGLMGKADKSKLDNIKEGATKNDPATAAPLMDGTAAVGMSAKYAREDHRHPTDTSRASADDVTAQGSRIADLEAENALLHELINGIDAPIYRTVSGNPVTFSDGYAANLKALSVELTATQSGSGEPYPPGGGKNLLEITGTSVTNNGVTFTVDEAAGSVAVNGTPSDSVSWFKIGSLTLTAGDYYVSGGATNYCTVYLDFDGYNVQDGGTTDGGTAFSLDAQTAVNVYIRAQGGQSNRTVYPMVRRASETNPAFAPYANIRPITGTESAAVTRTGRNLLDYDTWKNVGTTNGSAVFENNGVTLTASANDCYTIHNAYARVPVSKGETYVLSWENDTNKRGRILIFLNGLTSAGFVVAANNDSAKSLSVTIPQDSDVTFLTFRFGVESKGETIAYRNIMLRRAPVTDDSFEPYQGRQTVTVSTGEAGTVYGGTLNVTTGELTVTHALFTVDESTVIASYASQWDNSVYVYQITPTDTLNPEIPEDTKIGAFGISNQYPWYSYDTSYGDRTSFYNNRNTLSVPAAFCIVPALNRILVKDIRFNNDPDGLKAYMLENPATFLYKLAAPVTYRLTEQNLTSLPGYNEISADAGTVTVSYRADTALSLGG